MPENESKLFEKQEGRNGLGSHSPETTGLCCKALKSRDLNHNHWVSSIGISII